MLYTRPIQKSLIRLRHVLLSIQRYYLIRLYGMSIGKDVRISLKAKLDKTNPKGIFIGDETYIAFGATILCHDMSRNIHRNVVIGEKCFIGANSIILPGVTIGNHVIVGAGAVISKSIPDNCLVVGNPGQIIKRNILTGKWGIIIGIENKLQ